MKPDWSPGVGLCAFSNFSSYIMKENDFIKELEREERKREENFNKFILDKFGEQLDKKIINMLNMLSFFNDPDNDGEFKYELLDDKFDAVEFFKNGYAEEYVYSFDVFEEDYDEYFNKFSSLFNGKLFDRLFDKYREKHLICLLLKDLAFIGISIYEKFMNCFFPFDHKYDICEKNKYGLQISISKDKYKSIK